MNKEFDLRNGFYLDEWRIEPQTGRISRQYQTVSLEPKIMEVLVLLAENYPNVIRKEVFLETIWPDVNVVGHVLTRAISEIRRVLNDDPRNPHVVETIPKIGYRLLTPLSMSAPGVVEMPVKESANSSSFLNGYALSGYVLGAATVVLLIFIGIVAATALGGRHAH